MQVVYKNNMIPLFILETIEYAFILGKETAGILTVVSAMVLYNFPCDTSIWRQSDSEAKKNIANWTPSRFGCTDLHSECFGLTQKYVNNCVSFCFFTVPEFLERGNYFRLIRTSFLFKFKKICFEYIFFN